MQIQWLRALAALLVMLYHIAVYQKLVLHDTRLEAFFPPAFGYFGVALFFAISGYLMSLAIRVQTPFMFLCHRIARIYPSYFIATALACGLVVLLHDPAKFDSASLMLMPLRTHYRLLRVEWTLVFEIVFYVTLFLLALASLTRRLVPIALLWLGGMLVMSLILPDDGSRLLFPAYRMLTLSLCAPFAGGLLLPAMLRWKTPAWLPTLLAAVPCVVYAALPDGVPDAYELSRWLFGMSAVLLLWGMVRLSALGDGWTFGRPGRMFATYGDYSYALYLCHVPVLLAVDGHLAGRTGAFTPVIACGLSILASIALGRLDVELYRVLKARLGIMDASRIRLFALLYLSVFVVCSASAGVQYFRHDRVQSIASRNARQILQQGPIASDADAVAAASRAGYVQDARLAGRVDSVRYDAAAGHLIVDLWALDRAHPDRQLFIALFSQGRLLASGVPIFVRPEPAGPAGIRVKTGYHFEQAQPCASQAIVVVVFTGDRRFAVLPSGPPVTCG